MATARTTTPPRRSFDERGHFLPRTEDEQRRCAAEAIRALDEAAAIGDPREQEATLDLLLRGLDEDPA